MEIIVRPARARADREDVAVLVADDQIGADVADQPLMAAEPLAERGAQAEIVAREELDEAAGLDGEADIADRGADIVLVALALEAGPSGRS